MNKNCLKNQFLGLDVSIQLLIDNIDFCSLCPSTKHNVNPNFGTRSDSSIQTRNRTPAKKV